MTFMLLIKHNDAIFTIEVDASDTIDNVKTKIQDGWEIAPSQQALIFAGKPVTGGTVSNNNIRDYDMITLVTPTVVWTRRTGGMC